MAAAEDWRTPEKRRAVIQQLEDAIRNCAGSVPPPSLQNPVGVEKSIYDSAKSGEEYGMNIRKVILMITRRPQPSYPAMQQQQQLPSSQLMPAGAPRPTVSAPMHGMTSSIGIGRPPPQQAYQPSTYPQHQTMQHGVGMTHIPSPHPGPYAPSPHPASVMHPGMAPMHGPQRAMPPSNPMVQMGAPQGPMASYQVQPSHPVPMQGSVTYPPPPQGMYASGIQQRYSPQMARPPGAVGGMTPGMVGRAPVAPGMQFQQTIHRYPYSGEAVNTGLQSVTAVPNPSFSSVGGLVRPSAPPYTSPTSNVVQGNSSSSPAPAPTPAAPTTQETATHPPNTATSSSNPPTPRPNPQVAPSPAPPTPLLPASPITGVGSPTQPTMTPEENEAYLRKLGELQRYLPLMSRMLNRLSKTPPDERRNDQYLKLRSLHNLLQDTNRRVPLQTLRKCGESLEKMFGSHLKELSDAYHSHSSLEPPPSLPTAKLPEFSRSQSLLEFKMIPSPPPTCNNLLETIQAKPLPPERLPPAKRQCNREEPLLSPSLKRELAHLDQFEIRHVSHDNKFDKSILLECSLVDEGLPQVPSLTICIPPTYPLASPQVDLAHYSNSSSFLKLVGKLLSEELVQSHSTYTLSFLLTSWMECVMRATTNELSSPE